MTRDLMMFRARFDNGHQHHFEAAGWEQFLAEARRREAASANPGGLVVSLWYQFRGEWASIDERLDPPPPKLSLPGRDSRGYPRQQWADRLATVPDAEFPALAERLILSAAEADADPDPGSDHHWKCEAAWAEAKRRRKPELYQQAYDRARQAAGL